MKDRDTDGMTDDELDRALASLSYPRPRADFADRVMARVALPAPLAVRQPARVPVRRSLVPAAIWAAAVIGPLVASVVVALQHWTVATALVGGLTAIAGQWTLTGIKTFLFAAMLRPVASLLHGFAISPAALAAVLALGSLGYLSGLLALRRLMTVPGRHVMHIYAKLGAVLFVILAHATLAPSPALAQDTVDTSTASTSTTDTSTADESETEESEADDTAFVDLSNLRTPLVFERRLRRITQAATPDFATAVHNGATRLGAVKVAPGESLGNNLLVVRGNVDVFGKVAGNLVTLDGNITVHPGGAVGGDIIAFNGTVSNEGDISGSVRSFGPAPTPTPAPVEEKPSTFGMTGQRLVNTIGMFLTLMALGIAFVQLARPRLEITADTAAHSFVRSLLVGGVGLILVLPTFAIMVVGLIVSIVGILLLPFAATAYLILLGVAIGGGLVAVAHSLGEAYTRRQVARGAATSPNSYRSIALGLGALALPCLIGALFAWVPVVGPLLRAVAFLIIGTALTVGFGAMLLSRGGKSTTFADWSAP